jgi:hypothetical protein
MPGKGSTRGGSKRQVNIRLDRSTVEVLEAVMFLEELASLQEVVGPLIERYAHDRANDRPVQEVLAGRARFQASLWEGEE